MLFKRFDISLIIFAILFGLIIRLSPAASSTFPLNDGGLFFDMINDLKEANYALPFFSTYNGTEIPFSYPPLAFYITGLFADLFHISLLDLFRILPAVISSLTIPAFYLFARELGASKLQTSFGVFAFAVLPNSFAWLIMGGGITRSFGLLFALLTMTAAYRFYSGHSTRHLLACILLGGLTVATHPEATVHTAITALIFYLWKDRSRKGFLLSLGMGIGILAITTPWWLTTVTRHGIDPILAAINASRQDSTSPLISLILFFRFMFTNEPFLPILGVLGLIGLFASLANKQTLLPAWMAAMHMLEPRGGTLYMMIPMALLIGYALERVLLPALNTHTHENDQPDNDLMRSKTSRTFVILLLLYTLLAAYNVSQNIKNEFSLHESDLDAFSWVRKNTPEDAEFVLLTNQLPLRDAWSEWFPVLAERHSQATVFGYEWINDGQFGDRIDSYTRLQSCAYQDVRCLDNWRQEENKTFSYVYLYNQADPANYPLAIRLQQDNRYNLVYESKQAMIFINHEKFPSVHTH